jgi:hypothetical protein
MKKDEVDLIGLIARILGFLRDHNQHCYTAEELTDKQSIKRDVKVDQSRMGQICEELCKEALIEPKREDGGRCYQAVR